MAPWRRGFLRGADAVSAAAKGAAVDGVENTCFCDVHAKQAESARHQISGDAGKLVDDYRREIDDRETDAVHVATPDHWRTRPAAVQAGQHVYVEKALGHNVLGTRRYHTVHQIIGREQPLTVSAAGGRFNVSGMGDQPDVLQVTNEYPGFVLSYEICNTNSFGSVERLIPGMPLHDARGPENRTNSIAFYGSSGTLIVDRLGYELIPETGPCGGSLGSADASVASDLKRARRKGAEPSDLHAEHLVRCIRDAEPPRSDAATRHRSALVAHLSNIACKAGRKFVWDAEREDVADDAVASRMLGRKARNASPGMPSACGWLRSGRRETAAVPRPSLKV